MSKDTSNVFKTPEEIARTSRWVLPNIEERDEAMANAKSLPHSFMYFHAGLQNAIVLKLRHINIATLLVDSYSILLLVSINRIIALMTGLFASASVGQAHTLPRPPIHVDVVGEVQQTRVNTGETLPDIACQHDLGQDEILLSNPAVDRWLPNTGRAILLPNLYILPKAMRTGLILNVPEMRLYYFPNPGLGQLPVVITHPVSIGRMDWGTPLGNTRVVAKQIDPAWHPPTVTQEGGCSIR